MAYLKGGPEAVKGRWGKLEPGTREYAKRLGSKGVDYRAMRLYRSEIHRNQQEAAVEGGEDNPACTGLYDWILMPGRGTFLCNCPELAAGGPYTKDTIPDYPHPNCFPAGTMILMADGTEKPIEAVEKGDYVTGRDGSPQLVTETINRMYEGDMVKIILGGIHHNLILTPEHPVFIWNRHFESYSFIAANRIRKETIVAAPPSGDVNIRVLEKRICHNFSAPVYNLTTIPDHTYVANGIIVHNCDCMVEPRVRNGDELIDELRAYVKGEPEGNRIALWAKQHDLGQEDGSEEQPQLKYEVLDSAGIALFQKESDMAYTLMSTNQKNSIGKYTGSMFSVINDSLYGRLNMIPKVQEQIENIDTAMDKYSLAKNVIAYRGTSSKYYTGWIVGEIHKLNGFVSTSFDKSVAQEMAEDMFIKIRIPKGTKGLYIGNRSTITYTNEKEFLLGHSLFYKVISKTDKEMTLEVVNGR
jgi:hypothetical protein